MNMQNRIPTNSLKRVKTGEFEIKLKKIRPRHPEKPWLNADGSPKPDEEIKNECGTWSLLDWNNYLESLDDNPSELLLGEALDIEKVPSTEYGKLIFSTANDFDELPHIRKKIFEALMHLTSRENEAITLKYWHGLSRKEIAKRLGVSENTVKTHLRTGLKKLRDDLSTVFIFE